MKLHYYQIDVCARFENEVAQGKPIPSEIKENYHQPFAYLCSTSILSNWIFKTRVRTNTRRWKLRFTAPALSRFCTKNRKREAGNQNSLGRLNARTAAASGRFPVRRFYGASESNSLSTAPLFAPFRLSVLDQFEEALGGLRRADSQR
jgi:hypothetical protein